MAQLKASERALLVDAFGERDGVQVCNYCGTKTPTRIRLDPATGKGLSARQLRKALTDDAESVLMATLADGRDYRVCGSEDCGCGRTHEAWFGRDHVAPTAALLLGVLDSMIPAKGAP